MSARSIRPARIVGSFEHPGRKLPGYTVEQVYLEIMAGALRDAGLQTDDIDGLITTVVPGGVLSLAETLGLRRLRHIDGTDLGGASYVSDAGRAARLVESGACEAVLVIMGGLPLQGLSAYQEPSPTFPYEHAHGSTLVAQYAQVASRHMYEHGSTSRDLAEIKAAASYHAQFNPNALLQKVVTVDEVLESPWIAEPLHRLDCCVTTDGGGAYIVVSAERARELGSDGPEILAAEEAVMHSDNGVLDLPRGIAATTGPRAFESAGITPADIDYASIYDSFTITVLVNLEGLGFFEPGAGSRLLADGALRAPFGAIPVNTDGGGLCNNHPDHRGGMVRMIEAVRQLRGLAAPEVQIADAEFAVVHGSGYSLGTRAAGATAILRRGEAG